MSGFEGLPTAEVSMVMVGALLRRPWTGVSWSWLKGFESDMVVWLLLRRKDAARCSYVKFNEQWTFAELWLDL